MTDVLSVRPAAAVDLAAVDTLLARSYPRLLKADYPPSVMVLAVPLLARAKPRLVSCGTYYVVEDGAGCILGAGGWTRNGVSDVASVRHVATDPDAVRRGVGRALVSHIVAAARGAGVARLDCLSTRTAVPFYAAMGFQTLGAVEIHLAQAISFPAVRMLRRL